MTPDEIDKAKRFIWELNEKRSADRNDIIRIVELMRKILTAYQGSLKKQYRLRDRLRRKHDEKSGH